jgi:hypothetical protein
MIKIMSMFNLERFEDKLGSLKYKETDSLQTEKGGIINAK